MCDCLEKLEESIEQSYKEKGKEVDGVEFKNVGRFVNMKTMQDTGRKTKTDVRIVFKKGKPLNTYIKHEFCPFCGVSYNQPVEKP